MKRGTKAVATPPAKKEPTPKTENGNSTIKRARKRKSSSADSSDPSPEMEELSPPNPNGRQSRQRKAPLIFDPSDIHEKRKYVRRDSVSTSTPSVAVEKKSTKRITKSLSNGNGETKKSKIEANSSANSSDSPDRPEPDAKSVPDTVKPLKWSSKPSSVVAKKVGRKPKASRRYFRKPDPQLSAEVELEDENDSGDELKDIPILIRQDVTYAGSPIGKNVDGTLEEMKHEVNGDSNPGVSDESEEAVDRSETQETKAKVLFDDFLGCDCVRSSIHGQVFKVKSDTASYCQARERYGGSVIGCANLVDRKTLYRISPQHKLSVFCDLHISKLLRHQCCPYCGEFCTSGKDIIRCSDGSQFKRKVTKVTTHLFHLTCAAKHQEMVKSINGLISTWKSLTQLKCPHCGSEDMENLRMVQLTVTSDSPPAFLKKQGDTRNPEQSPSGSSSPSEEETDEVVLEPTVSAAASTCSEISVVPAETNTLYLMEDTYADDLDRLKQKTVENHHNSSVPATSTSLDPEDLLLSAAERLDIAEVLDIVLKHKHLVDKRLPSKSNMTLLHLAVESLNMCFVHAVVSLDPEFDVLDDNDLTPLMLAAKLDQPEIIKYLIAAGSDEQLAGTAGFNVLHIAVSHDKLTSVRAILERYPELANTKEQKNGLTPLMIAAKNGFTSLAVYLINSNLCNVQLLDNQRNSAMHWAAYSGCTSIFSALQSALDSVGLIEAKNTFGETPLDISFRKNHTSFMMLLTMKFSTEHLAFLMANDPGKNSKQRQGIRDTLKEIIEQRVLLTDRENSGKSSTLISSDISNGKELLPISCVNSEDDSVLPEDFRYVTTVPEINRSRALTLNFESSNIHNKSCRCTPTVQHTTACRITTLELEITEVNSFGNEVKPEAEPCDCHLRSLSVSEQVYNTFGCLFSEIVTSDTFTLQPVYECNELCLCNFNSCPNRVVQKGITAKLQVFRVKPSTTSGKSTGWGVRALAAIPLGGFICEYIGETLTVEEMQKLTDDSYVFYQPNQDPELRFAMNSKQFGNVCRFVNHSCSPNSVPVLVFTHHERISPFPKIALFTRREIQAGEEITFNYGSKFLSVKTQREPEWTCLCGTNKCLSAPAGVAMSDPDPDTTLNNS